LEKIIFKNSWELGTRPVSILLDVFSKKSETFLKKKTREGFFSRKIEKNPQNQFIKKY